MHDPVAQVHDPMREVAVLRLEVAQQFELDGFGGQVVEAS